MSSQFEEVLNKRLREMSVETVQKWEDSSLNQSAVAAVWHRASLDILAAHHEAVHKARVEAVKDELQTVIVDGICLRAGCRTIHHKHAYEKAAKRLAELTKQEDRDV